MEKNSNYIFLPLIGLFASILAMLIIAEAKDGDGIFPWVLLFILSVADIYNDSSRDDSDDYFHSSSTGTGTGNNRYDYNNSKYSSQHKSSYKDREESAYKLEAKKLKDKLSKSNVVKIVKKTD